MLVYDGMLNDKCRNLFFKSSIQDVVKDKVVLDVGSGTGILSWYALQAGAKHVYAIESNSVSADITKKVLEKKFPSSKFTVIRGDFLKTTPDLNVDVVISETIGHCIFEEPILKIWKKAKSLFPSAVFIPSTITCDIYMYEPSDLVGSEILTDNSYINRTRQVLAKENVLDDEFYDILSTIKRRQIIRPRIRNNPKIQNEKTINVQTISAEPFRIVKNVFSLNYDSNSVIHKNVADSHIPIINFELNISKFCSIVLMYKIGFNDHSFMLSSSPDIWKYAHMWEQLEPGNYSFNYNEGKLVDDSIWLYVKTNVPKN